MKIHKYVKDSKGIKIFTEIANQGTLQDYIMKKYENGQTLNEKNTMALLDIFVKDMIELTRKFKLHGLSNMHIKQLYVHNNKLVLGEPQLITDKVEKKLRELKSSMDYYAP